MNHNLIVYLLIVILFSQCSLVKDQKRASKQFESFGIVYSKIEPVQVKGYDLVVVEADLYTRQEIDAMRAFGATITGYLSLGEVNRYRNYFPTLEKRGLLGNNTDWGSFYLDLSDDSTKAILLGRASEIIEKNVDGLFLDTIDAVSPNSSRNHLIPHMVELIQLLEQKHPDKILIQNAGLFLLDETQNAVDAVTVEGIASGYDFGKKEYKVFSGNEFKERIKWLDTFRDSTNLPFLIVDFANSVEKEKLIRTSLDTLGIPYFLSSIELDKLPSKKSSGKGGK